MNKKMDINALWSNESLDAGWTAIPNSLIFLQSELEINSQELVILINIFMHRRAYTPKNLAFPSVRSIANRTGQTMRNVRRHLSSLEAKGFILRISSSSLGKQKGRNLYDVQPLIDLLTIKTPILNENLQSFRENKKDLSDNNSIA